MASAERPVVEVRDLRPDEFAVVVPLLARGFRDNPIPTSLFGRDPERRRQCLEMMFGGLFRVILAGQPPLVALDGETIVGVAGIAAPGTCQPTNAQRLRLVPSMLPTGFGSILRTVRVSAAWGKLDLTEPHSHLGPLAVDAHLRGRGIGTQILHAYCRRLDEANLTGYLETETEDNVRLYTRFGFKVIAEQRVVDVPNWFMRRPSEGS
jgi:ribosomal protein S18 acetylase RimI-like enzyme